MTEDTDKTAASLPFFGIPRLVPLVRKYRRALLTMIVCGLFGSVMDIGLPLLQKWFLVHSLADEIYALDVACRLRGPLRNRYYCLWNHAFNASYWVAGSVSGTLAGAELPIPSQGIEFAMVALFLVIFTDQMKGLAKRHD